MDETELKIEHEAPKLKLDEKTPEPVAPVEEPVEVPAPEPLIPEPTLTVEAPKTEEPKVEEIVEEKTEEKKPEKEKKKLSKKTIFLASVISGVVLIAGIITFLFIFSNKPAPTTTTTTGTTETITTTTTTTSPEPSQTEAEDAAITNDMNNLVVALTQFQTNNEGKVPANWDSFFEKYAPEINKKYKHDKEPCDFMNFGCKNIADLTWDEDKYYIHIAYNSACKKNHLMRQESGIRRITFYTALQERHNNLPAYTCASNEAWYD
jgi:hypothetical protein